MLTDIEWWGGLLFIWGALVLHFLLRQDPGSGITADRVCTSLAYGGSGLALALYFHASPWPWYPYLLAGVTGSAALCVLAHLYCDFPAEQAQSHPDELNPDDEPGPLLLLISNGILLAPPVLALILAGLRSHALLRDAGLLP